MKASELRAQLLTMIEDYGDLDVKVDDRDMGVDYNVDSVSYREDSWNNAGHWFQVSS